MKDLRIHGGWHEHSGVGAAYGGRRDSREGVHEHTGVLPSVRSCTPFLDSRSPVEPDSQP